MNKEEKIHEPQSRHPRSSLVGVRLLARDPETRFTGRGSRTTPSSARVAPDHSNDNVAAQAPTRDDSDGNAIYFDFNSANLKEDARPTLQRFGEELAHAKKSIRIEGNCDERGTTEYNIALGDKRAREAKSYLERLGVPGKRIKVVSYGSERPKYQGHDETAYAKNRRDDLVVR
jgi:peptidoglycan-associated lipoprotein